MQRVDINSWNDVYRELAKVVGAEATLQIYQEFRGQQMNFPMRLVSSESIRLLVQNEYNGTNLKELAKDYGYSERHLRRLLLGEDTESPNSMNNT